MENTSLQHNLQLVFPHWFPCTSVRSATTIASHRWRESILLKAAFRLAVACMGKPEIENR